MAINAVLAIIADSGRGIFGKYREGVEINYFLLYFIDSAKTLRWWPRPTPCEEAPGGAVFSSIKTCCWRGKQLVMVGMFVCLCLASQKPSEREFFVPARTDLGVKLLIGFSYIAFVFDTMANITIDFKPAPRQHLVECTQRYGASLGGSKTHKLDIF